MISVDEALDRILNQVSELAPQEVDLMDAVGCVLKQEIIARDNIPPFNNSAMDGYAVRYEDLAGASADNPVELSVLEDLPAGYVATSSIGPKQAIRIMTGAPVPDGASAVVMVEKTERTANGVNIFSEPRDGENIRLAGEDVSSGSIVLSPGKVIHAGDIGMLASLGFPRLAVVKRPVVAIIATGDELVDVGDELTPGKIRNSNAYSTAAQVIEAGAIPKILGIARDTEADVRAKISEGLTADAVITSGGVSVGDYDFVKGILDSLGEMLFWKVAMKPAKPLAFGMIDGKPMFGLPGNPTSSMVSFEQFVRPSLLKMAGHSQIRRQLVEVTIGDRIKKKAGRRYFVRVTVAREDGQMVARPSGAQGSGMLTAMTRANALLIMPEEIETYLPGDRANVQVLYPEECLW